MTDEEPVSLRYAVASSEAAIDSSRTQHPAYVGPHLLVIADGTRHMSSPGSASAIAVERLRRLDTPTAASDMTASLEGGIGGIRETFAELLAANRGWDMTLAMVTARLWRGTHAAIARIGSTGAYLLRGGDLRRLPRSHTSARSFSRESRYSLTSSAPIAGIPTSSSAGWIGSLENPPTSCCMKRSQGTATASARTPTASAPNQDAVKVG